MKHTNSRFGGTVSCGQGCGGGNCFGGPHWLEWELAGAAPDTALLVHGGVFLTHLIGFVLPLQARQGFEGGLAHSLIATP